MPQCLIVRFNLRVVLSIDYLVVLIAGNSATVFMPDGRPLFARDNRTRDPVHIQCVIMQPAQKHVRRNSPFVQDSKEVLGVGFYER